MTDSKFIIHGPTGALDGPFHISFGEFMFQQLKAGGQKIAQIHSATDASVTYADILQKSCNLATSLRRLGIKKGDVVSISAENRFEFSVCAIAIMLAGGINATLNVLYTKYELLHTMAISEPKIVICTDLTLSNITEATKEVPSVQKLIYIGDKQMTAPHIQLYSQLVQDNVDVDTFKVTEVGIHDPLAILCSSGTTGLPKGVVLTHHNFSICIQHLKFMMLSDKSAESICALMILPWFHVYGLLIHLAMLNLHIKYVFMTKFENIPFLKAIGHYEITFTILVPPLMIFLSKHPLVDNLNLSSLKEIWCAAAPLSKEIQEAVTKRLGVHNIKQGYGLTETTLAVTYNDITGIMKYGSSGKVLPGLQVKIVDIETGEVLGPNKTGEICVRGPTVMAGYHKNEAANKETFDSDGWLHTGDIAYYDDDEYFYIVDRLKELIKYKGFQVPPAELEALILLCPKVKDVGVVGLPDEIAGELPLAFVVKQVEVDLTEKEIIDYVASKLSYHKRLHGGVIFVDEIPKNPSGKILRRELREYLNKFSEA